MKFLKPLSFFVVISLCFLNTQCDEDDDFPNQITIQNNTSVQIQDNQNTYSVGDEIIIETNISLNQTTSSGETISLSDYDYSEPESAYRYYITLYKLNEFGSISMIPLMESNITPLEGNTTIVNGSLFVEAFFNGESYANTVSITLAETGTFYLAGLRFLQNNDGQLDIDGGVSEFAFVNINSTIVNANSEGGFEFFVN